MKKQSRRARSSSLPTVRHQLEHVVPTVIHNPEEEMTALGRLTTHAIKEPKRYLAWPLTIIACVFVGVMAWKLATSGRSRGTEVWTKLETAKTAEDRVNLAKEKPDSPAATWALLQAAKEYYELAVNDLPNNRDVALPTSKKALDLFEQVVQEAPHDSPQARAAALGKARVLEMRSRTPEDLAKALEQYQLVMNDPAWQGTPEAEDAKRLEEALKDPRAAAFYKDLYAFSPAKMTLPPFGTESLPPAFPGPLSPSEMPASKNAPFGPLTPTPNPSSKTAAPALPEVRVESKPQTPKAEADSKPKVVMPPAKEKVEPAKPVPAPAKELAKPVPTPAKELAKPVPAPAKEPAKPVPAPAKEKTEPAKPAETQKELPADVFSSKAEVPKEKAPH